jgi:hypothetical protein
MLSVKFTEIGEEIFVMEYIPPPRGGQGLQIK